MGLRDPEFRRNLLLFGSWKDKRIRRRVFLGIGGGISLVVLAIFFTGVPFVTNSQLCGRMCHATRAEYQSWAQSSHADVACHFCHHDSPAEKIINPIMRTIKAQLDSFAKPINADGSYSLNKIPKERCLYCHGDGGRAWAGKQAPGLPDETHATHLDSGLQCATCHNRVAHRGSEKFEPLKSWKPGFEYPDFTTMRQGCWRCHSRDGKYRDRSALDLVSQGKKPGADCALCHKSKWSLKPKDGPLNHGEVDGVPWRNGKLRHGKEAIRDFFQCLGCHERRSRAETEGNPPDCATDCHQGVTMPHNTPRWAKYYENYGGITATWIKVHSSVAAGMGVVKDPNGRVVDESGACSSCHDSEKESANYCEDCHHRQFSGNAVKAAAWLSKHPKSVKIGGTDACLKCHVYGFCTACHTGQ